jgi:hypothetical protein
MRLGEFVPSRMVEAVVHGHDLTRAAMADHREEIRQLAGGAHALSG